MTRGTSTMFCSFNILKKSHLMQTCLAISQRCPWKMSKRQLIRATYFPRQQSLNCLQRTSPQESACKPMMGLPLLYHRRHRRLSQRFPQQVTSLMTCPHHLFLREVTMSEIRSRSPHPLSSFLQNPRIKVKHPEDQQRRELQTCCLPPGIETGKLTCSTSS